MIYMRLIVSKAQKCGFSFLQNVIFFHYASDDHDDDEEKKENVAQRKEREKKRSKLMEYNKLA